MGKMKEDLKKVDFPLIGFVAITHPLGAINLSIVFGEGWKALRVEVVFIVVDTPNSYNTS